MKRIKSLGIAPARRVCERIERSRRPAGFAPDSSLPTVEEAALEWTHWFDTHYLQEPQTMPAFSLASAMLARMKRDGLADAIGLSLKAGERSNKRRL